MTFPPKYKAIEKLSGGKNANVYKAVNVLMGRDVFLKVYPINFNDSLSALKEPQLLCQLAHANLVKIYAADVLDDHQMLLEMELVNEGSYQDIIDDHDIEDAHLLPVHESLRLIFEAASGLGHLHSKGYVHRDVKPANLVIRGVGGRKQGVVTDLGLASKLNKEGRAFASHHARIYRPPEVWNDMGYNVSSDIYQLGIVLFQLLGGYINYSSLELSDEKLKKKVLSNEIIDIDSLPASVEDRLKRFIRKCVCSEEFRIKTTPEFVATLNTVKVNHVNWKYLKSKKGFQLEKIDEKGRTVQIEVLTNGSQHAATKRVVSINGKSRNKGTPEFFNHKNIGKSADFRRFINS